MGVANWFKPLFWLEENLSLCVANLDSSAAWYREKFGCKTRPKTDEDLGDWDDAEAVTVCSLPGSDGGIFLMKLMAGVEGLRSDATFTLIFCKDLAKGAELLSSRGVDTGTIKQDSDGSRYFEIRDPDGNGIQILQG